MIKKYYSILVAGILSASVSMSANAGTEWTIKIFDGVDVADINNSGQIVGRYTGTNQLFITGPDGEGVIKTIDLSGGWASAINDSGQITGFSGSTSAFITDANGENLRSIETLGGKYSTAFDINNSGQVVGSSSTPEGDFHAFVTGPNGVGMIDLGTLGGKYSYASAINESGQVVGWSETADGIPHAFITGPNGIGMTDLGTLPYSNASQATDINDDAQVVGFSGDYTFTSGHLAFITGPNGEIMTEIGILGYPAEINNNGQVILNDFSGHGLAFLYSDGVLTMFTGLPIFQEAGLFEIYFAGINDKGQILGSGYSRECCKPTSFLLTPISPVPEPSVYAMLLMGFGLLGFIAFKRKMKLTGKLLIMRTADISGLS